MITAVENYRSIVRPDGTFSFFTPLSAFEKADAPEGYRRRIGGLVSTETKDRQDEIVLQRGLDFSEFLKNGWYNDNHDKTFEGIVGEPDPDGLKFVKKGELLPNGEHASANGHWAEGWVYENDERADKIWSKLKSLQKSPGRRKFGFSIEGAVLKRTGVDNKIIAKARVRNVAITHCPVNTDTSLDVIAKSITAAELDDDSAWKALTMGASTATPPGAMGSVAGAGAGAILAGESLETGSRRKKRKKISKAEAFDLASVRFPNASAQTIGRIVDLAIRRQLGTTRGGT